MKRIGPWLAGEVLAVWPAVGSAQQNLFNVPSVEATRDGGLFFQQQTNLNALI